MIIVGPVLAGGLYEIFRNYALSFYIGGVSCILCAILLILFILVPDMINNKNKDKKCEFVKLETTPSV